MTPHITPDTETQRASDITATKTSPELLDVLNKNLAATGSILDDIHSPELIGDAIFTDYPHGVKQWIKMRTTPTKDWKIHLAKYDNWSVFIQIGDNECPDYEIITWPKEHIGKFLDNSLQDLHINWGEVPVNDRTLYNELLHIEPLGDILKNGGRLIFPEQAI